MGTKIIPFDWEMAKAIQAGKIQGKIEYTEDNIHVYNAEIIKFGLITDKARVKPNSTLFKAIVAIVDFDDYQAVRTFNSVGYGYNKDGDDTKLLIEVPNNESNESQFKPFDKVIVRDLDKNEWRPRLYSRKGRVGYCMQDGCEYMQILPYEGNEHLVGTTNKPKETFNDTI